jgi:hypothetical protein
MLAGLGMGTSTCRKIKRFSWPLAFFARYGFDIYFVGAYVSSLFCHDFVMRKPMSNPLIDQETYNPNNLLDSLIEKLGLKNDAALSRALEVAPPVISKIRHRRLPIGASLLIRMHEVSELSITELRALMGDQRGKFRVGSVPFAKTGNSADA